MAASGLMTAEEFESRFAKSTGKIRLSKGLWSRYLRGEVIPQGARTGNQRSLIERLGEEYPGTAEIFHHPLWDLLDFSQLMGPEELKLRHVMLGETIWRQFVACGHHSGCEAGPEESRFWRIPRSEKERIFRLNRLTNLDGPAACLVDARMGYLAQDEELFVSSLLAAESQFSKLGKTGVFVHKRMQSALLLIEGLCVGYGNRMVVTAPFSDEAHSQRRSKTRRWIVNWIDRCEGHIKTLSKNSETVFRRWVKQSVEHDLE